MSATADDSVDFAGRPELIQLLDVVLTTSWIEAARRGDETTIRREKDAADNPAIVRALGEA